MRLSFLGSFMMLLFFQSGGTSSSFQMVPIRSYNISKEVESPILSASASTLSGPGALLFFKDLIAPRICDLIALLQLILALVLLVVCQSLLSEGPC